MNDSNVIIAASGGGRCGCNCPQDLGGYSCVYSEVRSGV
jgi:hypothetical protein